MKKRFLRIEWLIPILVVVLVLVIGGREVIREHSSEYKYSDPKSLSMDELNEVENQLAHDGDKLVSQLGSFEDEYNLIHSLVFRFMNQVVEEFPGRVIETDNVLKHKFSGKFKRGNMYSENTVRSLYAMEDGYIINIEDINNPQTIQRFWEIAKSIFEPAGFRGGSWLPSRHMGNGLIDFDWGFVKPSGISGPHITWGNRSVIDVGGQGNLVINFTTDTRLHQSDLAKYRAEAATSSAPPTVTNQDQGERQHD